MVLTYRNINIEDNLWAKKVSTQRSSIVEIACETVWHDLQCGYYDEIDGHHSNTLEDDVKDTMWSGDCFYTSNEVDRIYIDGNNYLFGYLYVTEGTYQRIILVAYVTPEVVDFWDDEQVKCLDNLARAYFVIEY